MRMETGSESECVKALLNVGSLFHLGEAIGRCGPTFTFYEVARSVEAAR